MNIKIREDILNKIREAQDGEAIIATLINLGKRANNPYNRGIVHGYLLNLTVQGIIDNADALDILDQIER